MITKKSLMQLKPLQQKSYRINKLNNARNRASAGFDSN
jgi:hypothetical protein